MFDRDKYVKINESIIYTPKIKEDKKLLIMSDTHIHNNSSLKSMDEFLQLIDKENPDFIFLVGDIVDSPRILNDNEKVVTSFITSLSSIAKTYITLGNHELDDNNYFNIQALIDYFEKINKLRYINVLDNKTKTEGDLLLTGFTQELDIYTNNKLHEDHELFRDSFLSRSFKTKENKYNILLTHSPESIIKNMDILSKYDLFLTGHYHNGLTPALFDELFKNKGFISPKLKMFPEYAKGLIDLNNSYLLITGGVNKFGVSVNKYLEYLNKFYYKQFDIVNLTNDEEKNNTQNKFVKKLKL